MANTDDDDDDYDCRRETISRRDYLRLLATKTAAAGLQQVAADVVLVRSGWTGGGKGCVYLCVCVCVCVVVGRWRYNCL